MENLMIQVILTYLEGRINRHKESMFFRLPKFGKLVHIQRFYSLDKPFCWVVSKTEEIFIELLGKLLLIMKLPDIFNVVEKMSRSNIFIDLIISVIWHHRLQNRIWGRKIENKDNTSKHSPIKYKYWDFPSSVIRGRLLITLAWLIKIPFPIFLKYWRLGDWWWQFKLEG